MPPPAALPATAQLPRRIGKGRVRDGPEPFDTALMHPGTRETACSYSLRGQQPATRLLHAFLPAMRPLSETNIIQIVHEYPKQSGRRSQKRAHDESMHTPNESTRPPKFSRFKCESALMAAADCVARDQPFCSPLSGAHCQTTQVRSSRHTHALTTETRWRYGGQALDCSRPARSANSPEILQC